MNATQQAAIEAIRDPDTATRYMAAYEALLRKWPVDCESLQITTRYGSTHVIASGPHDAPPLVLLHAMQATALVWRPNVEELSRHFRVFAVDIIGQGGKSASNRPLKTRRDFADWLCELFDVLGLDQAPLVGNSYGGFLALNQASLAPERVKRVVLINPAGVFTSFLPIFLRMMWGQLLEALHLRTKRPKPDIAMTLGRNVRLGPDEAEWAALVSLVAFSKETRPNVTFPVTFSAAELRAIRKPAMLLMGDNELLYDPHATLLRAQQLMPSLQTQMVPGAHHMAAMAKPEEVNARIIRFLVHEEAATPLDS
jgi:pimeloyl-ACP methyl ester carboxylesterase